MSGDQESIYISEPYAGQCKVMTEIGKALRLRWNRSVSSESRVLEWVGSRSKWLAIHWSVEKPSFAQGSTMWARLTVVDPDTLTPATLRSGVSIPTIGPFRIKVWKASSGGQITPVWKNGVKEIQLEVFNAAGFVYITVDPDEYQKENPRESRGRLVFQPIE
ncbi:hypothetical protein FRC05_006233 [Tulasnella sp. 425]|nr:hypothetical protein FRC05_006233 [Tulasnella sp. 425]